ncbi:MAG: ABC transporter substrate-binding protein, partial [Dehalococcoidia bacterium]
MTRLVLAMALAGFLALACGEEEPPVAPRPTATPTLEGGVPRGGVAVLDMALRTVHVPAEVRRVVALSPSALEYVAAFDVEIVGRASDATFPAEAASAPTVGSTISPRFDEIAALEPDLVIADAGLQGALRRSFDEFPYPVFLIKVATYEESLHAFRAVAEAGGQKERGEELVAATEEKVAAAKESIIGKAQPKVLILTGSARDVYAGSDASYAGSLVTLLGATNVMGAAPQGAPIAGFGLVEVEQAAATATDVVLLVAGGQSDLRAQIEASPAWAESQAVRDGRVIALDAGLFLRSPGARSGDA